MLATRWGGMGEMGRTGGVEAMGSINRRSSSILLVFTNMEGSLNPKILPLFSRTLFH